MRKWMWIAAAVLASFVAAASGDGIAPASALGRLSAAPQRDPQRLDVSGRAVKRIRTIVPSGGRVDWSEATGLIAFDKLGSDGYYDVHVMRPDGGGARCLTCDASGIPQQHNGNPSWHPSGRYLVFQSEAPATGRGRGRSVAARRLMYAANPGAGFRNNLWVTGPRGEHFVQLTQVGAQGGVLHPHFSPDGSKLIWAQRLGPGGGAMGEWAVMVADFVMEGNRPRLSDTRKLQPGERRRFYETHGFFPDGRSVLISANPESGQGEYDLDIYRLDLDTGKLTNLTRSPGVWDEHAQLSPDGSKILWMSSRDIDTGELTLTSVKSDYWVMNADGSQQRRVTHFNDPNAPEYLSTSLLVAADSAWSPDGRQFLAYVKTDRRTSSGPVFLIDME